MAVLVLVLVASAAPAFWASSGAGSASAGTGSLNPPTNVSATVTSVADSVSVTWAGSTGGLAPSGYFVVRSRTSDGTTAAACGTSPTSPTSSTSCVDASTPTGTYTYTVTAVFRSWTAPSASSPTVSVVPTRSLAFTTQPGGGTGGTPLTTQPVVSVQDGGGSTVTSNTSSLTLALTTPAGATLACSANPKPAVAGVAAFAGCKVDKSGTYTLTATGPGVTAATSSSFTITAGPATKLTFTTQPGGGTSQAAFAAQPTVTVQDAGGNTVTSASSAVTLALTTPGGATLSCSTNPQTAVAGVAAYSGCRIDKSGSYTLTATGTGLTSATSSSFTVTAGSAAKLVFSTQPGNGTGGTTLTSQPTVTVQDAGGNTATGNTSAVTLALTTPGGATLSCSTNPQTAVAGVAAYSGCRIDKSGSYTLTATGTGLTSATSTSFTITAGPATKLTFTTQPGGGSSQTAFATQPTVAVQDAGGNTVTSNVSTVTLALTTPGGAVLACTPTSNARPATAGVAAFSGCKVDRIGSYTLRATGTGLTLATSTTFTITAGAPSQLVYVTDRTGSTPACPGGSGGAVGNGGSLSVFVAILDASGNLTAAPGTATIITLTKTAGGGEPPTPGTLSVPANTSPAVTSGSSLFKLPTGNPLATTYTATTGSLTTSCTISRN